MTNYPRPSRERTAVHLLTATADVLTAACLLLVAGCWTLHHIARKG